VLVFIKGNYVYMLVQTLANYTLPKPEFVVDSKRSLQAFYREITFNSASRPTTASTGLAKSASR
jgi:hypothetical protein